MDVCELNPYRFGLREAIKLTDAIEDGFQDDDLYRVIQGPKYTFTHPVPPNRRNAYLKCRLSVAFKIWLSVRDIGIRSFALVENGKYYGYVRWVLPQDYRRQAPWYHRLGTWLVTQASRILDVVLFIGENRPPFAPAALSQMRAERRSYFHTKLSPSERQKLAHYSDEELSKTQYDDDDYTRCTHMVVRKTAQGRGLGTLLFQESIKRLEPLSPIFLDGPRKVLAPPKLCLMSSPMGINFYKKSGFRELGTQVSRFDGIPISSTFMEASFSDT